MKFDDSDSEFDDSSDYDVGDDDGDGGDDDYDDDDDGEGNGDDNDVDYEGGDDIHGEAGGYDDDNGDDDIVDDDDDDDDDGGDDDDNDDDDDVDGEDDDDDEQGDDDEGNSEYDDEEPSLVYPEDEDEEFIVDTVGNKPMFVNPDDLGPLEGDASHPGQLDMRVGVIEEVHKHPSFDDQLVELVNMGSYSETLLQASSLAKRYKDHTKLKNRKVIVCCNVEPLEPREIRSKTGALLVATRYHISTKGRPMGEYCELLDPPDDSKPGDRVYVEGYKAEPYPYCAAEIYEWMVKDFKVNSTGQVVYKDKPLKVEGAVRQGGIVTTEGYFDCDVRLD